MSSSLPSQSPEYSTLNALYGMALDCRGMTALLRQYTADNCGNDPAVGHVLSGLGMLQHALEELQEKLDPCVGALVKCGEVQHERN